MSYLRLPSNFPSTLLAFLCPTCHCMPKMSQYHDLDGIFGISLLWFWIWIGSNSLSEARIEVPSLINVPRDAPYQI